MEKMTNSVELKDIEYPKDEISQARAEMISIFNTVSDEKLAGLKRKLKADKESSGIHSQPFVVDFSNTVSNYGYVNSAGKCNTHHDMATNNLYCPLKQQFLSQCEYHSDEISSYDLNSTDHPRRTDKLHLFSDQNFDYNIHNQTIDTSTIKVYPKHWFCERPGKARPWNRFKKVNSNCRKFTLDNRMKTSRQNATNDELQTDNCDENGENCKETGPSQAKLLKSLESSCLCCDFCDFSVLENRKMLSHLKCNQHYSASLVNGSFEDGKFQPLFVVKESHLVYSGSKYKGIVPICPKCDNIFPTIYMCAMHCQIHHDRHVSDKFTVAMVTEEKTIIISVQNFICNICKTGYKTEIALLNHWIKNNHVPYQNPENGTVVFFFCEYCIEPRPFYHFSDAYKHLLKRHHREHVGGDVYIRVRYLKRSSVGEMCLLRRSQMSIQKQFECDMNTLNMMIQPFNRCDTEKQNKLTKSYLDELRKKYFTFCQ